jgi:cytoskeletal protein RodZ
MDTSKKYRRFGIGALIVLGVVILIAIIVIANTVNKTPKASENTPIVTTSEEKKEEKKETKKEETKKETTTETPAAVETVDTESMPTTGPEDFVLPIVLIATSAYLVALNINWVKRGLRDEEKA